MKYREALGYIALEGREYVLLNLGREADAANEHTLNQQALRWLREITKNEDFHTPWGFFLHVDLLLLASVETMRRQAKLGPEMAVAMRETWYKLPVKPIERLQWWLEMPGGGPTKLAEWPKKWKNVREAMSQVVETFDANVRMDPNLQGCTTRRRGKPLPQNGLDAPPRQ